MPLRLGRCPHLPDRPPTLRTSNDQMRDLALCLAGYI